MKQHYRTVIDYKELHNLLMEFQNYIANNQSAKKMTYNRWREMIKATADDWALFDIEWEGDDSNYFIDIFYNSQDWSVVTGDNSFGDFIYKNLLLGVEMKMRNESPSNRYADKEGRQYYEYYDSHTGKSTIYEDLASKNKNNDNKTNKENFAMKFNFDFGPVNSSMVRMSLYGLAVKNKADTWVSYDAKAGDIMDVDILNFDGAKFLYKMPVAIKDIAIGDVVIHNGIPMFVIAIATNGTYITAVDPINGERKDIMLPKSPFGFNFATKVVNFLGNTFNASATAENPFGNMWMLMAMSGENKDMNDILPFLMMNNATPGIDNNVLMFMALSNTKDGSKDMLPWLLMMNTQNSTIATPAHTCTCGGHCDENHTQG